MVTCMYMVKAETQILRIVLLFGQQAASKIIHAIIAWMKHRKEAIKKMQTSDKKGGDKEKIFLCINGKKKTFSAHSAKK